MFQKSLNNHQILFYLWPSAGIRLPLLLPPIANPTYETYNCKKNFSMNMNQARISKETDDVSPPHWTSSPHRGPPPPTSPGHPRNPPSDYFLKMFSLFEY